MMGFQGFKRFGQILFLSLALTAAPASAVPNVLEFIGKIAQTYTDLASPITSPEQRRVSLLNFADWVEKNVRGSYSEVARWREDLPQTLKALEGGASLAVPVLRNLPADTRESMVGLLRSLIDPVLQSESPERFDYRVTLLRAWINHLIQINGDSFGDLISWDSARREKALGKLQGDVAYYQNQWNAISEISAIMKEVLATDGTGPQSRTRLDEVKLKARVAPLLTALSKLGPVYRKTGDMLAGFYGDVPVPASGAVLSYEKVQALFRERFRQDIPDVFSAFDPLPVHSGSLSQLHRATLKSNGHRVAVKIRRPGILDSMEADVSSHRHLILLGKVAMADPNTSSMLELLSHHTDDLAAGYLAGLDLRREAQSMNAFVARHGTGYASMPKPLHPYVAHDILVMDYVEGLPMDSLFRDASPEMVARAFRNFSQVFFEQLAYGHFHADLTPTNLAFGADGKLILYDWGDTLSLKDKFWTTIQLTRGLLGSDAKLIGDSLSAMGSRALSASTLVPIVERRLAEAESAGIAGATQALIDTYLEAYRQHEFRMTPDYARVVRGVLPLVGVILQFSARTGEDFVRDVLMGQLKYSVATYPWTLTTELWRSRTSPFVEDLDGVCFSELLQRIRRQESIP